MNTPSPDQHFRQESVPGEGSVSQSGSISDLLGFSKDEINIIHLKNESGALVPRAKHESINCMFF